MITSIHDPAMKLRVDDSIKINIAKGHPTLNPIRPHNKTLSIVAGGPNLTDKFHEHEHETILCVNQAHDWLISKGIFPDYCAFLDNDPSMVNIINKPCKDVMYLCASMTSTELMDKLYDYDVYIWHVLQGLGEEKLLPKNANLISGGDNIGQRAIALAHYMGYRQVNCYGLCGCELDGKSYAYDSNTQRDNISTDIHEFEFNKTKFLGTHSHIAQAESFWQVLHMFDDIKINVHGRGVIPLMAQVYNTNKKRGKSVLVP